MTSKVPKNPLRDLNPEDRVRLVLRFSTELYRQVKVVQMLTGMDDQAFLVKAAEAGIGKYQDLIPPSEQKPD